MIKKFSAQLLLIFSLTIVSFAQTAEEKPILIDEFGAINKEDWRARTDGAVISTFKNPNAKLKIKINGGINDYYSTAYYYASSITSYLRKNRNILPEKFSFDFCNLNKEDFKIQFFAYSANYDFPKCEENLELPERTVLFETIYSSFPTMSFTPTEESFADLGPDEGDYSKFALNALSRLLKKHPTSKVIVIGYLNANGEGMGDDKFLIKKKYIDKKSKLPKIFTETKKLLVQNGINERQIRFIDGGYMNSWKQLEFWLVPQNGKIPKPTPDYFPK